MTWIQTYSRKKFSLVDPRPYDVDIGDIAHALAHTCRYNGHTKQYYSVAEHCVHVSRHCAPPYDRRTRLAGLLHDATEAYVGDCVTPLKKLLHEFAAIEAKMWWAIAAKFNLPETLPSSVVQADRGALLTEVNQLCGGQVETFGVDGTPLPITVECWDPETAKKKFLAEFAALSGDAVIIDTEDNTIEELPTPAQAPAPAQTGEVRVVDPVTGGEKGSKIQRYSLLPWAELDEVAAHYGRGAAKYSDRNWERGYRWSLSMDSLMRHLTAWWGGESTDPETGSSHLSAVVFHTLALRYFEKNHPAGDDRPKLKQEDSNHG